MKVELKARDFIYNNGIVNLILITKKLGGITEKKDSFLTVKYNKVSFQLYPYLLRITGEEEDIRNWYRDVSMKFAKLGLSTVERKVVGEIRENGSKIIYNDFRNGYSYKPKSFAKRTWGTSITTHTIQRLVKKSELSSQELEALERIFSKYSDRQLKELKKGNLINKKEGQYYFQRSISSIAEELLNGRENFIETEDRCEICGLNFTRYKDPSGKNKTYMTNTSTLIFSKGPDYTCFKDIKKKKKTMRICAFCDLALRYAPFWSPYAAINNEYTSLIFFDTHDLISLYKLKSCLDSINPERPLSKNTNSNIEISRNYFKIFSLERLLILLSIYISERLKDIEILIIDSDVPVSVFGTTFSNKEVTEFMEYTKFSKLINLINEKVNDEKIGYIISKVLRNGTFLLTSGNFENRDLYEKEILTKILHFKPFETVLKEIFLEKIKPKPRINTSYLGKDFEKFIETFYSKFLEKEESMKKEDLELVEKIGWAIGTLVYELDEKGVFYEMRETKKLEHFLEVLRDISFRLVGAEKEEKLYDKSGGNYYKMAKNTFISLGDKVISLLLESKERWKMIRDLIIFFSINNYLKGTKNDRKEVKDE